jgi:hypothetical protein
MWSWGPCTRSLPALAACSCGSSLRTATRAASWPGAWAGSLPAWQCPPPCAPLANTSSITSAPCSATMCAAWAWCPCTRLRVRGGQWQGARGGAWGARAQLFSLLSPHASSLHSLLRSLGGAAVEGPGGRCRAGCRARRLRRPGRLLPLLPCSRISGRPPGAGRVPAPARQARRGSGGGGVARRGRGRASRGDGCPGCRSSRRSARRRCTGQCQQRRQRCAHARAHARDCAGQGQGAPQASAGRHCRRSSVWAARPSLSAEPAAASAPPALGRH